MPPPRILALSVLGAALMPSVAQANGNVHVSRFWHNHQPIYWPEWMGDGSEPNRGQLAGDSIDKKLFQNYGGLSPRNNPENDLTQIFSSDDRRNAYQGGPGASLGTFSGGGFAMSYSGSLMDNVRQLGSGGRLGYGGSWNAGNTFRRKEGRLDLLGFTHHHSFGPLLPKEVFRKEIQVFKQAWWKAWGGNADLSDHSKGFFPTEMAYTRDLIDVLVDEGYEWVVVASHHISRTSPTWTQKANPGGSYKIFSSPPNRADQLGPATDAGWWLGEGQIEPIKAWNLAPYAYQLHRVQYVNPANGQIKEMIAVPSDDVLSYQYGYGDEGIAKINGNIAPFANDPNRPVIVMPSTDGDNAWGGGNSSWNEATPRFFNNSAAAGYVKNLPGNFVDQFKQHATVAHIEDGAWIFPESCYGSPNFMKWIEPPLVNPGTGATNRYPGTQADMESPGYSLKFFSYAPLMAGANWVITAEQILRDQGGEVRPWVVHAPYGVGGGEFNDRNDVELAWHIYLRGLDSGFNYYGGLGNDDEVKPGLATKRAVDRLRSFMSTRMNEDRTGPTALKPQRFPYNPGGYTFGWFNNVPGDTRSLKKMPSYFYIWSHVYDVSGVNSVSLKIRRDRNGVRSLQNTHNVTYAGGSDVEEWITVPMAKRVLPKTRAALNAAANNGEIDFFVYDGNFQPTTGIEVADYYFAKIDDAVVPGFRNNLFDYHIESVDTRGNVSRSEIQHVFVEDDGQTPSPGVRFSANPSDCQPITVTYSAANGPLAGLSPVTMQTSFDGGATWAAYTMNGSSADVWSYTISAPDNAPSATVWFQSGSAIDSRNGQNWSVSIRDCEAPTGPVWTVPFTPVAGQPVTVNYSGVLASNNSVNIHHGFNGSNWTTVPGVAMTKDGAVWKYTYNVAANATNITMVFNFNGQNPWDNNGGSNYGFAVSSAPPPANPPAAPTGLAATNTTSTSTTLTWNAAANASGYILLRNSNPVAAPTTTSHTDTGLNPETTYAYTVRAMNIAGSSPDSVQLSVTTLFAPLAASQILVLDPLSTGPAASSPYLFRGRAGSLFTNGVIWSNALTGGSGLISFPGGNPTNGWEWTADIALGSGANTVTFRGSFATSSTQTLTDSPANYTAWSNGLTGGSGFGPWSLTAVTANAGHFLANNPTNMNVGSSTGFGLWANNGGTATAARNFNTPMAAGDTFALRFDNNWLVDGGETGFALADSNNNVKLRFHFVGGQTTYRITDATAARDSGWGYTNGGLQLTVTTAPGNTYTLSDGTRTLSGTLAAAGGPISRLIVENKNAGPDTERNLYIGAMTHTRLLSDAGTASAHAPAVTFGGPASGYDTWLDGDAAGEEMLVKYAIGGAATPDDEAAVPQVSHDGATGEFVLTAMVREDAALTVAGKVTPDLAAGGWTTDGVTAVEPADQSAAPAGCKVVEYRVSAEGGRRFLRLEVTHTP